MSVTVIDLACDEDITFIYKEDRDVSAARKRRREVPAAALPQPSFFRLEEQLPIPYNGRRTKLPHIEDCKDAWEVCKEYFLM